MPAVRKFGCSKCGQPIEAYPPDDEYVELSMEPCKEGDSKRIQFICDNCQESNVRYWDKHHFFAAVV